ncbi:MAG TPA: pyridoxamine 5'-phosphate oxidase family protein [Euzebyales bacterium]|nr:pyridoxamine 5'-phosphate oxidase family protein [Euzebyales bacterium]
MLSTRTSMIELSSDECLELLMTRRPRVGRLAFDDAGGPMAFPIDYIADGRLIYFRAAPGSALLAALEMRQVTFEIDHIDDVPGPRTSATWDGGWSVLAFGRLRMLTDEEELARMRTSLLRPSAHADDAPYLRMDVATLTGRRFV